MRVEGAAELQVSRFRFQVSGLSRIRELEKKITSTVETIEVTG